MTVIEPDDFRLLGPKVLGRVIGVSFLGQWTEDQVFEAFEKYWILIPRGFTVRITSCWVVKAEYMGFGSDAVLYEKNPLDNRLQESRIGVSGSFQITIAKFVSPAEAKRLENEKKHAPAGSKNIKKATTKEQNLPF